MRALISGCTWIQAQGFGNAVGIAWKRRWIFKANGLEQAGCATMFKLQGPDLSYKCLS